MELFAEAAGEIDIALPMYRGHAPPALGLPVEISEAGEAEGTLTPIVGIQSRGTFTLSELATRSYFIGDSVLLATAAAPGAEWYEWQVEHRQTGIVQSYTTNFPSALWVPQRAGHFVARVRSCVGAACTQWVSTVDQGYDLFAWLRPPSF